MFGALQEPCIGRNYTPPTIQGYCEVKMYSKEQKIQYYTEIIQEFQECLDREPNNPYLVDVWKMEIEKASKRIKELKNESKN